MFRTLFEFVIGLVALLVMRAVFSALGRMFSGSATAPPAQEKPREVKAEQLKQDPVCGTFVAASTAVTADSGGGLVYFCSKECRKQWEQKR